MYSTLPEWVKADDRGNIGRNLANCKEDIDTRISEIIEHVHISTKNRLTDDLGKNIVKQAIDRVKLEIDLLLLPAANTYVVEPTPQFDYCVADLFEMHRRKTKRYGGSIRSINKNPEVTESGNLDKERHDILNSGIN